MAVLLGLVFGFLFASLQKALVASFFVVFSLWLISVMIIDLAYGYSVGPVLVNMLGIKYLALVYLISSIIPALIAGLSSWVSFSFKKLF